MAEIDLKPTESMASNAERGLELREKHGKGGTAIGVARARDIKNRANLSPETVRRMHAFFNRHEKNKSGGEDDAGYIAWLLWGGDSGRSWAASKVKQLDRKEENGMSDTYKEINARLGALGKSKFAEASDRYGDALMQPVTKANAKAMERLAVEAIKHAKKVGDDDLLELAEQVGHEVQALRSRASRPGAKATFDEYWRPDYEQRAADRINIAYALMSKCEDKQREIAKTVKDLEKAINDMRNAVRRKDSTLLYDTEAKIHNADHVRRSFSRPGAKATMAAGGRKIDPVMQDVVLSKMDRLAEAINAVRSYIKKGDPYIAHSALKGLIQSAKSAEVHMQAFVLPRNQTQDKAARAGAKAKMGRILREHEVDELEDFLEGYGITNYDIVKSIGQVKVPKAQVGKALDAVAALNREIRKEGIGGSVVVDVVPFSRPGAKATMAAARLYVIAYDDRTPHRIPVRSIAEGVEVLKQNPNAAASLIHESDTGKRTTIAYGTKSGRANWTEAGIEVSRKMSRPGTKVKASLSDACWKGYEAVGTKQKDGKTVPNCVPKNANAIREGDEAKFGDVGSDDNKIRYLLGEAESAIQHNAGMSTAAGFVKKAEALVQDKTPADLRSRIQRVKSMMKDSNAVRKGKKVAR